MDIGLYTFGIVSDNAAFNARLQIKNIWNSGLVLYNLM